MDKLNQKAIIVALLILVAGILLIPADIYWFKTESHLWISIGCSLIASASVILMTELLVNRVKADPLEKWNLCKIYSTRAEKNADSDNENIPLTSLSQMNNISDRVFNKVTLGYKLILFISLSIYLIYCNFYHTY